MYPLSLFLHCASWCARSHQGIYTEVYVYGCVYLGVHNLCTTWWYRARFLFLIIQQVSGKKTFF